MRRVAAPLPRAPGAPSCKAALRLIVTPPLNWFADEMALMATVPPLLMRLMLWPATVLLTAPICTELAPVRTGLLTCKVPPPVPRRKTVPLGASVAPV